MPQTASLGRSSLHVSRLGIGAMTWGKPTGAARWTPAQMAYGPSQGEQEEERALAASLAAGGRGGDGKISMQSSRRGRRAAARRIPYSRPARRPRKMMARVPRNRSRR